MKLCIIALVVFTFAGHDSYSQSLNCGLKNKDNLPYGFEVLKQANANQIDYDNRYCQYNLLKRFMISRGYDEKSLDNLRSFDQLGELVVQEIKKRYLESPWEASLIPLKGTRSPETWWNIVLPIEVTYTQNRYDKNNQLKSSKELFEEEMRVTTEFLKADDPCKISIGTQDFGRQITLTELNESASTSNLSDSNINKAGVGYFCFELGGSFQTIAECYSAGKKILKNMTPREVVIKNQNGLVTPPFVQVGLINKVMTNQLYDKGLRLAALKMLERLKRNDSENNSSLITDLIDSYVESGQDRATAKELAWDVIGLISTAGPNLASRLGGLVYGPENAQTITALTVIASAIPKLDFKHGNSGHLYSYPMNVQTTCDNGKPYHFWMAAYLSREAAKESEDPQGAAAAAFASEKGYQLLSNQSQRKKGAILTHPSIDPATNIVRTDLVYAAAGAVYGVNSLTSDLETVIDVNQGLKRMNAEAKYLLPISNEQARLFYNGGGVAALSRWNSIFSPNTAYDNYSTMISQNKLEKKQPILSMPKKKIVCPNKSKN
jgi:hypothetical protein